MRECKIIINHSVLLSVTGIMELTKPVRCGIFQPCLPVQTKSSSVPMCCERERNEAQSSMPLQVQQFPAGKNRHLLRRLRRFSSDSTAVTSILFPPILLTVSINFCSKCSFSTSSPPPMLLPLIKIFGTVFLPVLLASSLCNCVPSGCSSSSTTYGVGEISYLSSRISLALRENGQ